MKLAYVNGVTSVILRVKIMDSTSTTGGAKTGLTFSSSGLIISTIADNEAAATAYTAAGSTIETITTLGTFAAPTATKCRFKEVDATNHPGVYEIQIANARWAVTDARSIIVSVLGATGAAQVDAEIQHDPAPADVRKALGTAVTLDANNVLNVSAKYWAGTAITATSIPVATAAGASGGLLISGSNSGTTTLGALTVSGATTLSGAVSLGSTLGVTGATTLTGNVAMAAGLTITQSSADQSALVVTGNGTGHGALLTSGSGVSGDGLRVLCASTNGNGLLGAGSGTGDGFHCQGGTTGRGFHMRGGTASGAGLFAEAIGTASGIEAIGFGTGYGALFTSGSGATGDAMRLVSASTNGSGLRLISTGSGSGLLTDKITSSTSTSLAAIDGTTVAIATSTSLGAVSGTTLTLSGAVAFQSTFAVTGTTTLTGAVSLGSTLGVTGTTTLAALTVTNALTVSGATTLTGAVSATNASNSIKGINLAAAGLDLVLVESGISASASLTDDAASQLTAINARQSLSLIMSAAAAGVLAGAATTTITTKPGGLPAGNTRVTATVDASGNRTALTLKVPT